MHSDKQPVNVSLFARLVGLALWLALDVLTFCIVAAGAVCLTWNYRDRFDDPVAYHLLMDQVGWWVLGVLSLRIVFDWARRRWFR